MQGPAPSGRAPSPPHRGRSRSSSERRQRRRDDSASPRRRSGSPPPRHGSASYRGRSRSRSWSPRRRHPSSRSRSRSGGRHAGGGGAGRRQRSRSPRRDDSRQARRSYSRSPSSPRRRGRSAAPPMSREELEVLEITRDVRTVFVNQLVARASARDIEDFFEQAGSVHAVQIVKDRSGRSRGCAYVEFEELESVPRALLLSGSAFCMRHPGCTCSGFPISVKSSEAEKNYTATAEAAGGTAFSANSARRVYLGGLDAAVTEADLRRLADAIGGADAVDKVALMRGPRGSASGGCAVITFATPALAATAIESLHGLPVGGRPLQAGKLNVLGEVVCPGGVTFPLPVGGGKLLSAQARAALVAHLSTATQTAVAQLGSTLIAATQAAAVQAAVQAAVAEPLAIVAAAAGPQVGLPPAAPPGTVTPCVLVTNVFNPAEESEEGWEADLAEEMSEVAGKYGRPLHIHLDGKSADGAIYLMFADTGAAAAMASALDGRKLGARAIGVRLVALHDYLTRFPEAAASAS